MSLPKAVTIQCLSTIEGFRHSLASGCASVFIKRLVPGRRRTNFKSSVFGFDMRHGMGDKQISNMYLRRRVVTVPFVIFDGR